MRRVVKHSCTTPSLPPIHQQSDVAALQVGEHAADAPPREPAALHAVPRRAPQGACPRSISQAGTLGHGTRTAGIG
eukprot:scaffold2090_cov225-Prasinococcus_capsulatus_cf.AAC.47